MLTEWCASVGHSVMPNSLWPHVLSLPGSSFHGNFLARILEWVAILFSRGSFWPRGGTQVSCIAGGFFTIWPTREVSWVVEQNKSRAWTPAAECLGSSSSQITHSLCGWEAFLTSLRLTVFIWKMKVVTVPMLSLKINTYGGERKDVGLGRGRSWVVMQS